MHQRDPDAVELVGAALVAAVDLLDALGADPSRGLEDGVHGAARLACDLDGIVDVIEMPVRDEHQVAAVDLLQVIGGDRVVHHPGVDQKFLAFGAPHFPASVADPGELDLVIDRHPHHLHMS